MRMSCNGCRVLRKGCSERCSIRPCLEWIKSPESQANATVFLAKFYGRAGLINLIHAGPESLRPAIFQSLLYEACGRIANPVYGSVGLLWSGSWQQCQAAVDAVLSGAPLAPIPLSEAAGSIPAAQPPPPKAYDIRHVSKADADLRRVNRGRARFKRPAAKTKSEPEVDSAGARDDSAFSAEADSHVSQGEASSAEEYGCEVGLELTLGSFERDLHADLAGLPAVGDIQCDAHDLEVQAGKSDLWLQLPQA